ncbi:hypothetical protein TrVE_jg565 [Triparma verrucosa]|uniref:Uncharacterized protein n=1 Tax=Triparma verrucosa TaxID=1606542 RepID=A0A9W7F1E4_9STRA|nr:hypothetical protein TrVE_jg565 [Triparma verrucosa]
MAFILVCGPPSSSKTETCNNLAYIYSLIYNLPLQNSTISPSLNSTELNSELNSLRSHISSLNWPPPLTLHTLSEHSSNPNGPSLSSHYPSSSHLKSSIASALSSSTLLLVDYGAPVKGWRYEVHCLVRQAECKFGVVWTGEKEGGEGGRGQLGTFDNTWEEEFKDKVEEIRYSFEIPNPFRDRWDRPLYKLHTRDAQEGTEVSAFDQEGKNDLVNPELKTAAVPVSTPTATADSQPINQGGFKKKFKTFREYGYETKRPVI